MSECTEFEVQRIEQQLILEAIYQRYGYDFRDYSEAHIKRRLEHRLQTARLGSISMLQHKILHSTDAFNELLADLSINVTEMFRDPSFYLMVKHEILPVLGTYPFFKVWHAGCSSGQEVYSMAILLKEAGLLKRSQIYATDFNASILDKASKGIYPADSIRSYTANYQQAGGEGSFADYYTAHYDSVLIDKKLRKSIVFSEHNLVTDSAFGEMNLICCRNVLIYFNRELQDKVIQLFLESLCPGGFLCLGSRESLKFSRYADTFQVISEQAKIYRKKR